MASIATEKRIAINYPINHVKVSKSANCPTQVNALYPSTRKSEEACKRTPKTSCNKTPPLWPNMRANAQFTQLRKEL